ncbi:MAG: agmatine deiminase family protein [Candidatus Micrarchaeota archaeon]
MKTPREENYFMPPEWAPHSATWLSWPSNKITFPERIINKVEDIYCRIISALSHGEKIKLLVNNSAAKEKIQKKLRPFTYNDKHLIFYKIKTADVWIRDYGPIFLLSRNNRNITKRKGIREEIRIRKRRGGKEGIEKGEGKRAIVKWKYNAYGEKYSDLLYDDIAGMDIAKVCGSGTKVAKVTKIFTPKMVLEGGSIEVNGEGTLLTTEQCLLNKNRNPNLSRNEIEKYLRDYLGVSKIIWLKSGIEGDDTDGHVDDFARFISKGKIVCACGNCNNKDNLSNLDGIALRENLRILHSSADTNGNKFEVIELPMPKPIIDKSENRQLPASYANFYIGNKIVLLPIFNNPHDKKAIEILENSFPEREIVPIVARELVFGYGGIHCITQQEPL